MARTVEVIKALLYAEVELKPDLKKAFENPSQVKYWGELLHTMAVNIAVHEQLMDYHYTMVLAKSKERVFNADWLIEKVLNFQYDSVTPQVTTLNADFEPVYNPIDETLRILSLVVLYRDSSRLIHVKVAKSSPPVKLAGAELTALQSYLTDGGSSTTFGVGVGFSGAALIAESVDPDYIWLEADIQHSSDVTSTIQAAVTLAIKNYYYDLGKDGYLQTITLVDRIQAVQGVTNVLIKNLAIRANGETFSGPDQKHYLVTAYTYTADRYVAVAGYAYEEVTAGQDLATKLTFKVG